MDGKAQQDTTHRQRHIGRRLMMGRLWRGLTPEQLARHVNLPVDMLNQCEAGHRPIDAARLLRITQSLSLPVDYFFHDIASGITRSVLRPHD